MSWLVGYTIVSMVVAVIVVWAFDHIVSGVRDGMAGFTRALLFIGSWTAVTVGVGMRAFTRWVRGCRQNIRR